MSDDQPPEDGSRRSRRETREAGERAAGDRPEQGRETPVPSAEQGGRPEVFDGQAGPVPRAGDGPRADGGSDDGSNAAGRSAETPEAASDDVPGGFPASQEFRRERREEPVEDSEATLDAQLLGADEHIEHNAEGTPVLISSSDYGRGYQTVTPLTGTPGRRILDKRRQRRRRRNITLAGVLAGLVVLMVVLAVVFRTVFGGLFSEPEDYEAVSGDSVTFSVERGDGWSSVAHNLVSEDIIASAEAFDQALQETEEVGTLQVGEYELKERMPAQAALDVLAADQESQLYVALNAGTRIEDAFKAISEATEHSTGELEDAAEDPTAYGLPEQAKSLEGYLAAGEYRFDTDVTAQEILQQMVDRTMGWLEEAGVTDPAEQYEVVTKASLLTAEAQPDDYRTVAGIIENRLQPSNSETGGYLQIDSTTNYGIGERDLQLSRDQLEDSSNEYSTHAHRGLPPGPIEAVTQAAIEAAADPEDNDYYYWVTTNIETGETKFAETYSQHQEYVEEYKTYCEDHADICGSGDAPNTEGNSGG